MSNKIYTMEELKAIIQPLLIEYHAESAILFGSYARGEAMAQSDIDLIVVGGADFHRTSIFGLTEKLYERSGKRVDVFAMGDLKEDSPLLESIERDGIHIAQYE